MLLREDVDATLSVPDYTSTSFTGYEARSRAYYAPWALDRDHPLVQQVFKAVRTELDGVCAAAEAAAFRRQPDLVPALSPGPERAVRDETPRAGADRTRPLTSPARRHYNVPLMNAQRLASTTTTTMTTTPRGGPVV